MAYNGVRTPRRPVGNETKDPPRRAPASEEQFATVKRIAIVWGAVVVLLLGGCSQQSTTSNAPAVQPTEKDTTATQPAESSPLAVGHIHAMGINPADATLYAGTHYGVYRFPADNPPERVGEVVQDFMGFAVIGPDHFLGSGHPGAHDRGQPSSLGLIESTDGARSWKPVSLSGRADFHALVYRHDRVYGQDSHSGKIMISDDMRTWESKAQLAVIGLAISPHDPTDILATTDRGLQRSRDDGQTFSAVDAAPPLVLVSWPDHGPLVGVDATGTVYTSDDPAANWQTGQQLESRPQALITDSDGVVFVATEHAIYRSNDHGATFTQYRELK